MTTQCTPAPKWEMISGMGVGTATNIPMLTMLNDELPELMAISLRGG